MRRLVILAASSSLAVATAQAATPSTGTTVSVASIAPVAAGSPISVAGEVTFAPDVFVAVEDPAGDATGNLAVLGTDITKASITSDPARPGELLFAIDLTTLPGPAGGIPDAIMYEWDVTVDEGVPGAVAYAGPHWRRSNVSGVAFGGSASADPFIRFIQCSASCAYVRTLPGGFDASANRVTATVTLSSIGAKGGSLIGPGTPADGANIRSSLIAGVFGSWWFGGDDAPQEEAFRVPTRDVQLALVAAGDPEPQQFPVAVKAAGSGAAGTFAASVPTAGFAPGAYDLVARACWGSNCGTARAPVTLT